MTLREMKANDPSVGDMLDRALEESGFVQCNSCKEWWHEDAEGRPYISDWCVDNTNAYCTDCRQEMNE